MEKLREPGREAAALYALLFSANWKCTSLVGSVGYREEAADNRLVMPRQRCAAMGGFHQRHQEETVGIHRLTVEGCLARGEASLAVRSVSPNFGQLHHQLGKDGEKLFYRTTSRGSRLPS